MTKRLHVEVDADLLDQARRVLRTKSDAETIHAVLLAILRSEASFREVEALAKMQGMDLDDPEVMKHAWRQ